MRLVKEESTGRRDRRPVPTYRRYPRFLLLRNPTSTPTRTFTTKTPRRFDLDFFPRRLSTPVSSLLPQSWTDPKGERTGGQFVPPLTREVTEDPRCTGPPFFFRDIPKTIRFGSDVFQSPGLPLHFPSLQLSVQPQSPLLRPFLRNRNLRPILFPRTQDRSG